VLRTLDSDVPGYDDTVSLGEHFATFRWNLVFLCRIYPLKMKTPLLSKRLEPLNGTSAYPVIRECSETP
jgi:hypothetical protein